MKKLILIFLCSFNIFTSQAKDPTAEFYHNFSLGIGAAVGPEHLFSFIPPKVSLYYYRPLNMVEFYCGAEFSASFLMSYFSSTSIVCGFKSNLLTFETSLSNFNYPSQTDFDTYQMTKHFSYLSLNPKVGLKFGWFWFKFGPGIRLTNKYLETDFIDMKYNYEISLNIPLKMPNYKKIKEFNSFNH